jgi:predicted small secreted protein
MKKVLVLTMVLFVFLLASCATDAQVASQNLSLSADQFEINRRVVFYNGITGDYILVVEGLCSIEADTVDNQLELTCKVSPTTYKKHFLGLSDNVTYFAEQLEPSSVSEYHYRVIFKPSVIIPDIDVELP